MDKKMGLKSGFNCIKGKDTQSADQKWARVE